MHRRTTAANCRPSKSTAAEQFESRSPPSAEKRLGGYVLRAARKKHDDDDCSQLMNSILKGAPWRILRAITLDEYLHIGEHWSYGEIPFTCWVLKGNHWLLLLDLKKLKNIHEAL